MASGTTIFRPDNRLGGEIRPIQFTLDTTPAADGSATCEMGLTVVQVAVYGPREARRGNLPGGSNASGAGAGRPGDEAAVQVDVSVAGFVAGERRKRNRGDRRIVEMASAITNTFEPVIMTHLYPRSVIDIYVTVLSQDGGMLSAAINATTLALVHAGIAITRPLCSLAVSALHDTPLLDPSGTEETDYPTVTIACLAPLSSAVGSTKKSANEDMSDGRVTLVNMETRLSIDRFEGMLKLAVRACKVLSEEMDDVIRAWTEGLAQKLAAPGSALVANRKRLVDTDADMQIG